VVAVDAEGLWVETVRRGACGGCAARAGCGHALLDRADDGRRGHIRVLPGEVTLATCRPGDLVRFHVPDDSVVRGSVIAYGLPLVAMLAGALASAGWVPGNEDAVAASGALAGLLLGYALVRWHGARHRRHPDFEPVLLGPATALAEPVTLS